MKIEQPLTGIEIPLDNDVPLGRGGFINSHSGHRRYLKMVQDRQLEYVTCKKSQKTKIAWSIVRDLRALDPPARFLQKESSTGLWHDVGDKRFREKVSQALREHQPFIKAVIDCDDGNPRQQAEIEPMDIVEEFGAFEPVTCGLTDLQGTDKRRQTFLATSKEEGGSVLSGADDIDQDTVEFHGLSLVSGMSLGDFSVSQGPSFSSFHSYPPFERQSGRWENLMDETISTAFKIGLDFPESSTASSRGVSAQDMSLLSVPDDGIGNQKIDWAETCLSLLDIPRPRVNKRVLSIASGNSTLKRSIFNWDKSHSF